MSGDFDDERSYATPPSLAERVGYREGDGAADSTAALRDIIGSRRALREAAHAEPVAPAVPAVLEPSPEPVHDQAEPADADVDLTVAVERAHAARETEEEIEHEHEIARHAAI